MIGEIVSHYRILDKLGGADMGVVYRAEYTRGPRYDDLSRRSNVPG